MDNRIFKPLLSIVFTALVFCAGSVRSDDTDVYLNNANPLPPGSEPMVMFSLDYRANLAATACSQDECDTLIREGYLSAVGPYTFFDVLRAVMRKVFDPLEGVRVGLMLNHDNATNCAGDTRTGCSNGGYIAMGFQPFDKQDTNGAKERFHKILASIPTPLGNQSHSYQGKELFFEFFRYMTGQGVFNAHNGYTDYGTNNKSNLDVDFPAAAWDPTIELPLANRLIYESPLESAGACAKIYTVNTLFQVSNQDNDSDDAIERSVALGGFGSEQREFADVIQYLNDADLANGAYDGAPDLEDKQNVTSYFIVAPEFLNTTTIGYARAGGTGTPMVLSDNPDQLVSILQEIFKQILSVSTTFVAASVPVNVFNRAEITDNVYIALFQVDEDKRPYWVGNIKKLKLLGANNTNDTSALVDALGAGATATDGRIRFDALTYWTVPNQLPAPDESKGEVAGRDGRTVARGGAGQRVPGVLAGSPQEANGLGGRTIYYDNGPDRLAGLNVDQTTASTLQEDLGASTLNQASQMIAFARGLDVDDLDGDNDRGEARSWIFGDPLHSRPLPINYGLLGGHTPDNPAIYVAVASNDGMLHMIRNTTAGGAESGQEVWAFMPRTSMPAQKVLRANAPGVKHPYTIDGAPVAFIQDRNQNGTIEPADGDKVYLYVGLRRGGKAYYALDVTSPESPRLMWTIKKDGDFAELGYTFSDPRVGLVNTGNGPRPVVMFAAGYDLNKDTRGVVGTNDSEGTAIYVVDAETGKLVWKARGGNGGAEDTVFEHPLLVDSIPSTLSVADTDGDGYTDRLVVGDTGGNIWRVDIASRDTRNWKLALLASVGRHAPGAVGIADDRRFFHRPDLVQATDNLGIFDGVLIGSGNRANPLDDGGLPRNYFYMIKDRNTTAGSAANLGYVHSTFGDVTDNCLQEGTNCLVDLSTGWRMQLEEPGEKVLATPLTVTGKVFFTTYLPQGGSGQSLCAPSEGAGRLYAVGLQDGRAVINYDTSDDSPDAPDTPSTRQDRYVDLNSAGIPAEVVSIPPNKILRPDLQVEAIDATTRWRTYWYITEDADL